MSKARNTNLIVLATTPNSVFVGGNYLNEDGAVVKLTDELLPLFSDRGVSMSDDHPNLLFLMADDKAIKVDDSAVTRVREPGLVSLYFRRWKAKPVSTAAYTAGTIGAGAGAGYGAYRAYNYYLS